MGEYQLQFEFVLRIILAGVFGGLIGFERKNRKKEAGIRTHIIVALASALMMIISKYGFADISFSSDVRLDPSRIASQIVTGVGFLGAGMIFVHRNTVKGLTTAAGIWATSGIGMAVGAGMYIIGSVTTLIIIVAQILLHKNFKFIQTNSEKHIIIEILDDTSALSKIKKYFTNANINIENMQIERQNGMLLIEIDIVSDINDLFDILSGIEEIKNIQLIS